MTEQEMKIWNAAIDASAGVLIESLTWERHKTLAAINRLKKRPAPVTPIDGLNHLYEIATTQLNNTTLLSRSQSSAALEIRNAIEAEIARQKNTDETGSVVRSNAEPATPMEG